VALKVLAPGRDVEIETIEAGHTELVMIDMNGREVRRAIDGEPPPGRSTVHLDLTGIAAGRYFLILRTPTVSKSATMEVVR
jgi:hypothetical protein